LTTRFPFKRWQIIREQDRDAFCSSAELDLDLDPMTLIYEFDLDILKTTCIPKLNFLCQGFQKLEHYRKMRVKTLPHRSCVYLQLIVNAIKLQ